MKVYELMQQLSKMPSGAEVKFNHLMSVEELTQSSVETTEEGVAYYPFTADISDTDISGGENIVYLYT